MRRLIVVFIVFISASVFAQKTEYSIIVKDIETQLPIENATVVILKTQQILLSNEEGKVTFMLSGGSNIKISGQNYEDLTMRWVSLDKSQKMVAYLQNKNNKLEEVVLSKDAPQKILQKIVANSIKQLAKPYQLKVFVREFFLLGNKYSYYNDGLVNFQFTIKQRKPVTTLLVEQNRSYGLLETDVSADLKGYNLNNIMENYYNLNYFNNIVNPKSDKEYDYSIKAHPSNEDYYIMSVSPLNKSKKVLDTYEIVYDPDKKIIIEFTLVEIPNKDAPEDEPQKVSKKSKTSKISKPKDESKIGFKKITKSSIKVNYRLDGLDYYLLNSNEEIAYDLVSKNNVKSIEVRNSFITTNFNKQKFTHRESDVFKEKSLFNKRNKIMTNYWDISGFTATDEEKKIIEDLDFKM